MSDNIPGKRVAIVTGTGRGIGQACAKALLRSGQIVVGGDHAAADPELEMFADYHHHLCDLSQPEQAAELVDRTQSRANAASSRAFQLTGLNVSAEPLYCSMVMGWFIRVPSEL